MNPVNLLNRVNPVNLFADVQSLDQIRVSLSILHLQVIQQAAAAADQHEEAAARMVVLRVCLEVFGQVVDAFAENGDLHFGGAGVLVVCLIGPNQLGLAIFRQRHEFILHARLSRGNFHNQGAVYQEFNDSNKLNMLHQDNGGMQKPGALALHAKVSDPDQLSV